MTWVGWLLTHHVVSIAIGVLALGLCASVLRQRRPTGSALAWLLIIVLVPYVGIPLYLTFGGRKFRNRAREKQRLQMPAATDDQPHTLGPITTLGRVEWLDDGVLAYEAFLREIAQARRSIRIVTFVVGNDSTGRSLLEALVTRASQGIEVRLLLDDLLRFHAPADLLSRLEAAGGRVARFMPLLHVPLRGQGNLRNHRKIAVFDGERAIVGGMNLADEYMGPSPSETRWRDLSTFVTGQAVAALDAIFRADWEFAAFERLAPAEVGAPGPIPVRVIPSGPDSASDPIYDTVLTAIFRAERRFWIATPYFVPDEALARALTIAAGRGVDVRVIVPQRSNHRLPDLAAGPFLRDLAEAGVQVKRYGKMLHAKAVLVDDAPAMIGSANFDMRSLFLNYEIALLFTGPTETSTLASWFEDTLAAAETGPSIAGPLRAAAGDVARLISPLL